MPDIHEQEGFSEAQHALLFAWISRAVMETVGEQKGQEAIRKAVLRYGTQRGKRMALRARANGDPLNMLNYMAYGEWKASPGKMEQAMVEKSPHARIHIPKCPWYTTWDENGLLPYGRYYCLVIDEALASGFNPELQIDVNGTRSNGAGQCEFIYHDANLTPTNESILAYKKAVVPGESAVMPWEYHVGHLYTTLKTVLTAELGAEGQKAVEQGLAEFKARFGEQASQNVVAFQNTDFDALPVGS